MEVLVIGGLVAAGYIFRQLTAQNDNVEGEGFDGGAVEIPRVVTPGGSITTPAGSRDVLPPFPETQWRDRNSGPAPGPDTDQDLDDVYQGADDTTMTLPLGTSIAAVANSLAPNNSVVMNPPGLERAPKRNAKPIVSGLSGRTIAPGQFAHANEQPFFGAKVRQNMTDGASANILDMYSGAGALKFQKQEQGPLFDSAEQPYGNPYGMPSITSYEQERVVGSKSRAGELPFTQIKVGPGMGDGYSAQPSGGFGQNYAGEVARASFKDVNELRPGNKPKESHGMPVGPAKSFVTARGIQAAVPKNAPPTFYDNADGHLTGGATSAVAKPRSEGTVVLQATTRPETTTDYTGTAGQTAAQGASYVTGSYHAPHTVQLGPVPYAPADLTGEGIHDTDAENADYGRAGIDFPETDRDVTQGRSYGRGTNVGGQVASGQVPQEAPRPTRKQDVIWNPNEAGYMTGPNQLTVYDPNDVPRTTIKETNIHNVVTGVMAPAAPSRGTVYDPADIPRATIKETTVDNDRTGDVGLTSYRGPAYDPDDKPRATVKETMVENERTGDVGLTSYRGQVYDPEDVPRATVKETTVDGDYGLNLTGAVAATVRDPNDVLRTTVKETMVDNDYTGALSGPKRLTVYDPDDAPRLTMRNTMADVDPWLNTAPAAGQAKPMAPYTDGMRPTQKVGISREYEGGAGAVVPAERSQAAERNMRHDGAKESLSQYHQPATQGPKTNVSRATAPRMTTVRCDTGDLDTRPPTQTRVLAITPERAEIGKVRARAYVVEEDRNSADLLTSLKTNPFAKTIAVSM